MPTPKELAASQSLKRLHDAARQVGYECLDSIWRGRKARYQLRCAQGHVCTRLVGNIYAGLGACTECAKQKKLERLHQFAQEQGGKCLESAYLGNAPHRFVCAHGHAWQSPPDYIFYSHTWCARCSHIAHGQSLLLKDGLERLQRAAAEKGGACLSNTYTGRSGRYQFICAKGHRWETKGLEVLTKGGAWCGICARDAAGVQTRLHDGLERLQRAASEKGGVCLSQQYLGGRAYYRLRCQHGHEWDAEGNGVMRGIWCLQCKRNGEKLGIELMQQIAEERGGCCLSTQYVDSKTNLHWECHRGHQWHTKPHLIRRGSWCPECAHMNKISNPKSKAAAKYRPAMAAVETQCAMTSALICI